MSYVSKGIIVVGLAALAFAAYVRLAPSDPETWHSLPAGDLPGDSADAAMRRVPEGDGTLARLDDIIRATPRTHVIAGSVEEGMITYVTRSAVFGFPDYTTVARKDGQIVLYGRLRFGQSDFGVNGKRLDGWLAEL